MYTCTKKGCTASINKLFELKMITLQSKQALY